MSALPDLWPAILLAMALDLCRPATRLGGWRTFVTWAAAGGVLGGFMSGRLDEAGICASTLAVLAWSRWNRKGKRVARQLGAKSRGVLAAVVERAREAGAPLPQGARA